MTAALFGKIPNEAGAALDLLIDPLDGVGRPVWRQCAHRSIGRSSPRSTKPRRVSCPSPSRPPPLASVPHTVSRVGGTARAQGYLVAQHGVFLQRGDQHPDHASHVGLRVERKLLEVTVLHPVEV